MARQEKAGQAQACPLAKKCGGCDYQGIAYEEQLKKKEQTVKKISFPPSPLRHLISLPRRKNISYQDFFSLALVCSLWNLSYLTQLLAVNRVP